MGSSGTDRVRRTAAGFALAALMGLTAACSAADEAGSGDDAAAAAAPTKTATTKAAATTTAATEAAPAQKVDDSVSGDGMKGGCDAVHKLFAALHGGDQATAQSLRKKAMTIFNDVAATEATKDLELAKDGAMMGSMLDFTLPPEPIYHSRLADTYRENCVARQHAAALPG